MAMTDRTLRECRKLAAAAAAVYGADFEVVDARALTLSGLDVFNRSFEGVDFFSVAVMPLLNAVLTYRFEDDLCDSVFTLQHEIHDGAEVVNILEVRKPDGSFPELEDVDLCYARDDSGAWSVERYKPEIEDESRFIRAGIVLPIVASMLLRGKAGAVRKSFRGGGVHSVRSNPKKSSTWVKLKPISTKEMASCASGIERGGKALHSVIGHLREWNGRQDAPKAVKCDGPKGFRWYLSVDQHIRGSEKYGVRRHERLAA